MLLIDEHIRADGETVRTTLERDGDHVVVAALDAHGRLSIAALDKVLRRYGRPLEPDVAVTGPALDLGAGRTLTAFRYRAAVDAIGRDYLAYACPGEEPIAALSNGVAAALRYLVMRLAEGA